MKIKADKRGIQKECSFEANANAAVMETVWHPDTVELSVFSLDENWVKNINERRSPYLLKKGTSEQFWSWEQESRSGPEETFQSLRGLKHSNTGFKEFTEEFWRCLQV